MKVAGVLLLILGSLLFAGGLIGAISNSEPPLTLCRMADEDAILLFHRAQKDDSINLNPYFEILFAVIG